MKHIFILSGILALGTTAYASENFSDLTGAKVVKIFTQEEKSEENHFIQSCMNLEDYKSYCVPELTEYERQSVGGANQYTPWPPEGYDIYGNKIGGDALNMLKSFGIEDIETSKISSSLRFDFAKKLEIDFDGESILKSIFPNQGKSYEISSLRFDFGKALDLDLDLSNKKYCLEELKFDDLQPVNLPKLNFQAIIDKMNADAHAMSVQRSIQLQNMTNQLISQLQPLNLNVQPSVDTEEKESD